MGRFQFNKTRLAGLWEITIEPFFDERGFFLESYNQADFAKNGVKDNFVQDNHSKSQKGILRGLHYQNNPSSMGKLVRCLTGRIFDVGVDIRKGSPTFGQWYGTVLAADNFKMLYLPPGFAHGFLSLTDDCHVFYKCTSFYDPKCDTGIIWNDPAIGIKWPVEEVGGKGILSPKDQVHPLLKDAINNLTY
jgi:dTDP-4-dehydrorhamnose 3,5-epimerase